MARISISRPTRLPVQLANLTHSDVHLTERDNPIWCLSLGQQTARNAYHHVGVGGWKKRMLACNEQDRAMLNTKVCRRPAGLYRKRIWRIDQI